MESLRLTNLSPEQYEAVQTQVDTMFDLDIMEAFCDEEYQTYTLIIKGSKQQMYTLTSFLEQIT